MDAIFTSRLTKKFGLLIAVNELDLHVRPQEIFGLVGPDGAGKSTTMRMLASILTPTSGEAKVLGHSIYSEGEAIKNSIGYMSQRFGLYPDLTVNENIEFYADIYNVGTQERVDRKHRLLDFSGLKPFINRLAGNLSGGMKQKLGLCCALIHSPKLVLLDEPTNGVDPVSRRDFWKIMKELQHEKITIFMATSYLDEAEKCDRVGLLNQGKLFASGTVPELRKMMPGILIAVQLKNARSLFIPFQEHFGKSSVRLFGNKIHIYDRTGKSTIKDVHELARKISAEPQKIEIIQPSLEDIFVSLL